MRARGSLELTFRVRAQLFAHYVVRKRALDGLEQAVRQDEEHVLDFFVGHQLRQDVLRVAAFVARQQLPHLCHRQITLKIDHQILAQVIDQSIHGAEITHPDEWIKATEREVLRELAKYPTMVERCPVCC